MLEIDGLTHRFDDRVALADVSLRVDEGEFVLLVGANGSGKTTLLDHFSGLRKPDAGSVRVDGHDVAREPVAARTAIGRVFEDPRDQLLAATVGTDVAFGPENLGVPRPQIETRVTASLEAVGMAGREDESIQSLSGGERARVAIAGALAMRPAYLALDEPTTGIDHRGRTAILQHLRALNDRGVGIVIATHDLRELRGDADRVIGLDEGRLVLDASPAVAVDRLADLGVRVPTAWTE